MSITRPGTTHLATLFAAVFAALLAPLLALGCAGRSPRAGNSSAPAPSTAVAQAAKSPEDRPLPIDPAVRTGFLPNGLRYYVRAHQKPEHRASLRLVANVGSVLEDGDQRGYAHF